MNLIETTNNNLKYINVKKRERNPNITLNIVIKSQGKRAKEEERSKKIATKKQEKTEWK